MTKLSVPAHHRDLPRTLSHHLHKRHEMKLSPEDGVRFECDGCKLPGTGLRYECGAGCNVDLHVGCALAPPRREIGGFPFVLLPKPKGGDRRLCDACGSGARGLAYHCPKLDHDVHPCCADLPDRFKVAGLSFELRMKKPPRSCVLCADDKQDQRSHCLHHRAQWSYRCDDAGDGGGAVLLHVSCAKDLASVEAAVTSVSVEEAYNKVMASEPKSVVVAGGGLKRGKQHSGDAHRTKHSTGKEIVPATTATKQNTSKEIVPVSSKDLRALLMQGRDVAKSHGGGALQRSLKVLGFFVRVVIGVIFGDPTAMAVAVAGVFFPNR